MEKFKLLGHEHPLYHVGGNQIKENRGRLFYCDGCYGDGHLDSGYRCVQCWGFYLHKKCGESSLEINHPSHPSHPDHPEHPLQLLIGSECSGKRCHLCGVNLELLCYHCSICDFTLDIGCATNPPLPIIEQPKVHEHTLTLTSSTDDTVFTCHVCDEKHKFKKYLYSCSVCDLFFHIDCAFLALEINHPSHPRHLLQLMRGGSSNCCILCWEVIKPHQNCYHCSICNFTVDLRCVKNPPPLVLVSPKTHKHQLMCLPRCINFTCNACGKQGYQSPYVCFQCNFMVHRFCIDLPRVIWINRHDHRISHTYDLDVDTGNLDLECGVCHQAIDPFYGAYSCLECQKFVVHSRCATKYYVWDGRDLEGEPEEIEDVSPFKIIGNNLIKHFSHEEHDMKLIEDMSTERKTIACRACIKPIIAEQFYRCVECYFSLHEVCANLPCKIRSVLHEEKLILVGDASCFHHTFCCGLCDRYSSGFRYTHKGDDFALDLQCSFIKESLKREAHPHPLYFITKDSIKCSSCEQEASNGYECLKGDCVFSLCFNCSSFPETVKHKSDDHTLRLCYQEYGYGKYWCDICEKEVDSRKQYYTCDDCGTTFHIKCVLEDLFGSISLGSKITLKKTDSGEEWEYDVEVVPNISVSRPLCCVCHSRCTSSLVLKVHIHTGLYVCSRDCLLK